MTKYFYLIIFTLLSLSLINEVHAKQKYFYIFENSYNIDVKLGKVAKILHYGLEVGLQVPKGILMYQTTGDPMSTSAFMAYEIGKTPPMIAAQSLSDLEIRYYFKKKDGLKSLSKVPHIKSIKIFSTSQTEYNYSLAEKQKNKGLVFIETDRPISKVDLPADIKKLALGDVIEIPDLSKGKIQLFLEINGHQQGISWSPTLKDIFSGKNFPSTITKKWKKELDRTIKKQRAINRTEKGFFMELLSNLSDRHENVKIKAMLIDSKGKSTSLGIIAEGKSAIKLIKSSLWQKAKKILTQSSKISPKKFPISTTKVKKSTFKNCYIRSIQNFISTNVYK